MAVVHQDFQEAGAIEALRATLKDESWGVRRKAAVTLGWVGGREAVAELIELLESDSDWHVREQSAGALGLIGDRSAVDPLVNALRSDREFPVRLYCARALGYLADPGSVAALGASLQDGDQDVRREARHALHSIGGQEAQQVLHAADSAKGSGA
jgi:HEAT repeat protein